MKRLLGLLLAAVLVVGCFGTTMTVEAASVIQADEITEGMVLAPGTRIGMDNFKDGSSFYYIAFLEDYEYLYDMRFEDAYNEPVPNDAIIFADDEHYDNPEGVHEVLAVDTIPGANSWKVWKIFDEEDGYRGFYFCPGVMSDESDENNILQVHELTPEMLLEPGTEIRADECKGAYIEHLVLGEEFSELYDMDYYDALDQIWIDGYFNELSESYGWELWNENELPGDAGEDTGDTYTVLPTNVSGFNCWKVWNIELTGQQSFEVNSWDQFYVILVPAYKEIPQTATPVKKYSPACDHIIDHIITQEPTELVDGIVSVKCTKCDYTEYSYKISGHGAFMLNCIKKINAAAPGTTVTIKTNKWNSFNEAVLKAIEENPDVTVVLDYWYTDGVKGERRCITIPAGSKLTQYVNEEGFCGFEYIAYQLAVAAMTAAQ